MSIFGWDYPPGCSSVPGDEPDLPETCPACGGENANEDGDPLYADDPAFCGAECVASWTSLQNERARLDAEAEAAALRELDALNDRSAAE
jgi:hypothetical protein